MIRFTCAGCGRVVEVGDGDAGLSMSCPTCGQRLQVPGAARADGVSESARPRLSAQAEPDRGMVAIEDCPQCGKALQVPEADAGRRVACPRCNTEFAARALKTPPRAAVPPPDEPPREPAGKDEDRDPPRRAQLDVDEDDEDRPRKRPGQRYCTACGAAIARKVTYCPKCDARQPVARDPALADAASKKLAAGLCAILIGGLGVHKFILGFTTAGVIMLLISFLTCGIGAIVMHVISIIEGITYLTRSDEDFYQLYIVEKKEWF